MTDSTASLSWTLPYHAWKYSEFVFGYIPRYPSVLRVCIIMIYCYKMKMYCSKYHWGQHFLSCMKICTILMNSKHSNTSFPFPWKEKNTNWDYISISYLQVKIQIGKFCLKVSGNFHQTLSTVMWKKMCFFLELFPSFSQHLLWKM